MPRSSPAKRPRTPTPPLPESPPPAIRRPGDLDFVDERSPNRAPPRLEQRECTCGSKTFSGCVCDFSKPPAFSAPVPPTAQIPAIASAPRRWPDPAAAPAPRVNLDDPRQQQALLNSNSADPRLKQEALLKHLSAQHERSLAAARAELEAARQYEQQLLQLTAAGAAQSEPPVAAPIAPPAAPAGVSTSARGDELLRQLGVTAAPSEAEVQQQKRAKRHAELRLHYQQKEHRHAELRHELSLIHI